MVAHHCSTEQLATKNKAADQVRITSFPAPRPRLIIVCRSIELFRRRRNCCETESFGINNLRWVREVFAQYMYFYFCNEVFLHLHNVHDFLFTCCIVLYNFISDTGSREFFFYLEGLNKYQLIFFI